MSFQQRYLNLLFYSTVNLLHVAIISQYFFCFSPFSNQIVNRVSLYTITMKPKAQDPSLKYLAFLMMLKLSCVMFVFPSLLTWSLYATTDILVFCCPILSPRAKSRTNRIICQKSVCVTASDVSRANTMSICFARHSGMKESWSETKPIKVLLKENMT